MKRVKKYYRPKHYNLSELAHPQVINAIGEANTWLRLDALCLMDIDTIRVKWHELHGTGVYCNRLIHGIDSRGLRPPNDPDGGFYSTHKEGNTFDLEPVNGKHEEFYLFCVDLIQTRQLRAFNTMEDRGFTPTWSHLARMNHSELLLIIEP